MSTPRHQHFIPQSYIKNFAQRDSDKFFLEAKHSASEDVLGKLLSVKDICVKKNIYTMPHIEGENKYALERYYAEHIDAVYPEVYEWLTNPNLILINGEQRGKIITTLTSMYFRTSKFVLRGKKYIEFILKKATADFQDEYGNVKAELGPYKLEFNIVDINEVRQNLLIQNRIDFIDNHLKDWHEFVHFKLRSSIYVYEVDGDVNLISSDNPVSIRNPHGNQFNVFDPSNIFSIPIDPRHYVYLMPTENEADLERIYRGQRDFRFALGVNLDSEQNCEDWIFGKPGDIQAHVVDQIKYGADTPENREYLQDLVEWAKTSES